MSESFWDFSLRTYGQSDVPEACLLLQNQSGVDVNVLLYCCWYGRYRGEHDQKTFKQILNFTREWSTNVVKPLRGVRSWMKDQANNNQLIAEDEWSGYRNKIKANELQAEKMQQFAMASLVENIPLVSSSEEGQREAILANIEAYFQNEEIKIDDAQRKGLMHIVAAALGE